MSHFKLPHVCCFAALLVSTTSLSTSCLHTHTYLQVSSTAQGPHVAAHHPVDGFASREEQQQYLELEREVAEMQRMLEEATAAAERGQQSHSDQQYLSEILGESEGGVVLGCAGWGKEV